MDTAKGRLQKVVGTVAAALTLALCGCGDNGKTVNNYTLVQEEQNQEPREPGLPLMVVAVEPPGANCATGGSYVRFGFDASANGLLESSETTNQGYICNVAGLTPGFVEPEPIDVQTLMHPEENRAGPANFQMYENTRSIQFYESQSPWQVPWEPTWRENPYNDNNWQFCYQSLFWLWVPIKLYEKTGDPKYLSDIEHYVFSWIDANGAVDKYTMQWHDHATAYRTAMLSYVYQKYLRGKLGEEKKEKLFTSLSLHGGELARLLQDKAYRGSNHSMFHAIALYTLARSFANAPDAPGWKLLARGRVSQLLDEMVDTAEGVSKEQSMGYHWVALQLFDEANDMLKLAGDGLTARELQVLDRMLDFGAVMALPNRALAPLGDTEHNDYATTSNLRKFYEKGYGTGIAAWYYGSPDGVLPAPSYLYRRTGYAAFRPSPSSDFQLLVDFGKGKDSHGHSDALSFLLYANGSRLLTDSGGPYSYGSELQKYFSHARAHNTVVVDGSDYAPGDGVLLKFAEQPAYTYLQASHRNTADVNHIRTVILLKPDLTVILDELAAAEGSHRYDLLYHLTPGATVTNTGAAFEVAASGTSRFLMEVHGGTDTSASVITGADEPQVQGWITTSFGERIPAPVLQVSQTSRSAWYATVIKPFVSQRPVVAATVRKEGEAWGLNVVDGFRTWNVYLPVNGGDPVIDVKIN